MHEISLNIDNIEVLREFLNFVIDEETFEKTERNSLTAWRKYGFSQKEEIDLARKSLTSIFTQYALAKIDQRTLKSYFSYLSSELQESIVAVLESRKEELLRRLVFARISAEQKAMESFDWDVKWILGSSSSSTVQKLITSLTINCRKGKDPTENLHIEMDKTLLDKMIAALENCESNLSSA
ncbi:uncharacterized protein LOC132262137 [Phlebotomus argentipes]|uniref:uncharacterized protein LOC132262137 n=1 Tax=Phlebotomus argentipes TaxID=94469 RepID=UPI002892BEE8|nr:uncharacterized protein LOC132262137 [Phlebotomus argentipes]